MLKFRIKIIDCSLRGCKWVPHGTYQTRNSNSAKTSVILNHLEILVVRDYTVGCLDIRARHRQWSHVYVQYGCV